jgi:Hint domain
MPTVSFTYTGSIQTWSSLPTVGTAVTVTVNGAGGGGNNLGAGSIGGAGAQVVGIYTVVSGSPLYVVVGGGGKNGGGRTGRVDGGYGGGGSLVSSTANNGGSGGGYSGLFSSSSPAQGNAICMAGGGGGAGNTSGASGGAGGDPGSSGGGGNGGGGGSTTAGGTAGTDATDRPGTPMTGGSNDTSSRVNSVGGGGGGYYGGGSGLYGGGGGASYVTGLTSYTVDTTGGGGAGGGAVADGANGSVTLTWTESGGGPCFTAESQILTPTGYKSAADIKTGHLVTTADGRNVPVRAVCYTLQGTTDNAPYSIPKNLFGLKADLLLSPYHAFQIAEDLWMLPITAAELHPSVKQHDVGKTIKYYNFELPNYFKDNLLCDGNIVESLSAKQVTKSMPRVYVWSAARGGYTRWNPYQAAKRMSVAKF